MYNTDNTCKNNTYNSNHNDYKNHSTCINNKSNDYYTFNNTRKNNKTYNYNNNILEINHFSAFCYWNRINITSSSPFYSLFISPLFMGM
ncbi:uncharacterized [Tachysurus ichikawai]